MFGLFRRKPKEVKEEIKEEKIEAVKQESVEEIKVEAVEVQSQNVKAEAAEMQNENVKAVPVEMPVENAKTEVVVQAENVKTEDIEVQPEVVKNEKVETMTTEQDVVAVNIKAQTSETDDVVENVEAQEETTFEVPNAEPQIEEIKTEKAEEPQEEPKEEKKGFFRRLVSGLAKTRQNIVSGFESIFSAFSSIDDDFYEELEETLIMGDIGVATTEKIIEDLKVKVKEQKIKEPAACKQLLMDSIKEQMNLGQTAYEYEHKTSVLLVIGVNGVGKTTSIGKLAGQFRSKGKKVVLAAADTFRAAAIEQLTEWANRSGADIISSKEGADPASVIYDAAQAAKARKADLLICDTAGRLHNKKNLMEELKKINRILDKEYPEAYRENLIVLDSTTGQNALVQAKQFMEAADITGIILTKMDGTAKGGIAVAIQSELGIPVKYIGVGEHIEDLQKFDSDTFVNALFETEA